MSGSDVTTLLSMHGCVSSCLDTSTHSAQHANRTRTQPVALVSDTNFSAPSKNTSDPWRSACATKSSKSRESVPNWDSPDQQLRGPHLTSRAAVSGRARGRLSLVELCGVRGEG